MQRANRIKLAKGIVIAFGLCAVVACAVSTGTGAGWLAIKGLTYVGIDSFVVHGAAMLGTVLTATLAGSYMASVPGVRTYRRLTSRLG